MAVISISLPTTIARRIDEETKRVGYSTRSEFFRTLLRRHFAREVQFKVFTPKPLEEIKRGMLKTGKYNRKFVDSVIAGLSESSAYAH